MNQEPTTVVLDRDVLLERIGGDVEFLQEIAGLFLEECPKLVFEIRTAIASGDAGALERAAHTLKGSVSNFAAQPASEAARRLELIGRTGHLQEAPEACGALETEIERFTLALVALAGQLGTR